MSKWTNFLTPEEIKETERAFSKKNNSKTFGENKNKIHADEYDHDFEEFSEKGEEDFDCESYLQMNSVNNKEEGFLQNTSKTFVGDDVSNTWSSFHSKSDFQVRYFVEIKFDLILLYLLFFTKYVECGDSCNCNLLDFPLKN